METNVIDHYSTLLKIHFKNYENKTNYNSNKIYTRLNFNVIETLLNSETWCDVYHCGDVNAAYNVFVGRVEKYVQEGSVKFESRKRYRHLKPWITDSLIDDIKERDKLKKRLLKYPDEDLLCEYREKRNKLTKKIQKAKNCYFRAKFDAAGRDIKKIWNTINESVGGFDAGKSFNYSVIHDNELVGDKHKVAEIFNDFFGSVGNNMATAVSQENNNTLAILDDFPKNIFNVKNSIFLHPVTETEIFKIINNLKNNSAPGLDGIRSSFIKRMKEYLVPPLVHIINLSFSSGIFPDNLKHSLVTPIFKNDDKSNINNYRPISVISQFAKIFEKAIAYRLNNHLKFNNIISSSQYGFQTQKSTEDALFSCFDHIYKSLENNSKCLAVFLDLAKAFDTVCHNILLDKLETYGIRGVALSLFKSYLADRMQSVKIDDKISSATVVRCGVPQGTVLGPLLFLCYINDLLYTDIGGKMVSYADDTVLIFTDINWDLVKKRTERGIFNVRRWLNKHLLSLNINKTKFLTFSFNVTNQPILDALIMHWNCNMIECNCNAKIHRTNKIKYLGIVVDGYLRWDKHIELLVKRLKCLLYVFYRLRYVVKRNLLTMTYKALVESILQYGIILWGGTYDSLINPISIIQKLILKIMFFKCRLYPTDILFEQAQVLDVRSLYVLRSVSFIQKNPFLKSPVNHAYVTRNKTMKNIGIMRVSRTRTQRFLTYLGPLLYNGLPLELKRESELSLKNVKLFLLQHRDFFYEQISKLS